MPTPYRALTSSGCACIVTDMDREKTMYIFDVDGVISDVFVDEIDSDILSIIAGKVDAGSKIAFNTGRTGRYILENVIGPLSALVTNKDSLDNVLVVSEMGGEMTTFRQGTPNTDHTEFSMSDGDIDLARAIFREGACKAAKMESDKSTMVSISIIKGSDESTFLEERGRLQRAFAASFSGKPVEIITTVGSVDIFSQGAGKRGGAKIIGEWLTAQSDVSHDSYVCFGDSPSDYAMAEYFAELGMKVEFVFTGKDEQLPEEKAHVPIFNTLEPYTAGTKAYFANQSP